MATRRPKLKVQPNVGGPRARSGAADRATKQTEESAAASENTATDTTTKTVTETENPVHGGDAKLAASEPAVTEPEQIATLKEKVDVEPVATPQVIKDSSNDKDTENETKGKIGSAPMLRRRTIKPKVQVPARRPVKTPQETENKPKRKEPEVKDNEAMDIDNELEKNHQSVDTDNNDASVVVQSPIKGMPKDCVAKVVAMPTLKDTSIAGLDKDQNEQDKANSEMESNVMDTTQQETNDTTEPPKPRRSRFPKAKPNITASRRKSTNANESQPESATEEIKQPPAVQRMKSPPALPRVMSPPVLPRIMSPPPARVESSETSKEAVPSTSSFVNKYHAPARPHPPVKSSHSKGAVGKHEEKKSKREFRRTRPLDEAVDATKLTMRDLIYLNPTSNRMKEYVDDETATPAFKPLPPTNAATPPTETSQPLDGAAVPSTSAAPESVAGSPREGEDAPEDLEDTPRSEAKEGGDEVDPEEEEEDALQEEEEPDETAPQVMIGEDGQIVIKESSLTIARPEAEPTIDDDLDMKCREEANKIGYGKRAKVKQWSRKETKKFYVALSSIGTDFSLMANLFPLRDRNQLKRKFKLEDKKHRAMVDKALSQRKEFDMALFDNISSSEEEEAEDKKAKKKKTPKTKKEVVDAAMKETAQKKKKAARKFKSKEIVDVDDDDDTEEEEEIVPAPKKRKSSDNSDQDDVKPKRKRAKKAKPIEEDSQDEEDGKKAVKKGKRKASPKTAADFESYLEYRKKKAKPAGVYDFQTTDEDTDVELNKDRLRSKPNNAKEAKKSSSPARASTSTSLPPVTTLFSPRSPLKSPPPSTSTDPLSHHSRIISQANIDPTKIGAGQFVYIKHTGDESGAGESDGEKSISCTVTKTTPSASSVTKSVSDDKQQHPEKAANKPEKPEKRIHVYMVSSPPPGTMNSPTRTGASEYTPFRFGSPKRIGSPIRSDVFGGRRSVDSPLKVTDLSKEFRSTGANAINVRDMLQPPQEGRELPLIESNKKGAKEKSVNEKEAEKSLEQNMAIDHDHDMPENNDNEISKKGTAEQGTVESGKDTAEDTVSEDEEEIFDTAPQKSPEKSVLAPKPSAQIPLLTEPTKTQPITKPPSKKIIIEATLSPRKRVISTPNRNTNTPSSSSLKSTMKSSDVVVLQSSDDGAAGGGGAGGGEVIQSISDDDVIPQGAEILDLQVNMPSPQLIVDSSSDDNESVVKVKTRSKSKVLLSSDDESIDVGNETVVHSVLSSSSPSNPSHVDSMSEIDKTSSTAGDDDGLSQLDGICEIASVLCILKEEPLPLNVDVCALVGRKDSKAEKEKEKQNKKGKEHKEESKNDAKPQPVRRAKIQPKVNLKACRSRKSVDQKELEGNQTPNKEASIPEPITKEFEKLCSRNSVIEKEKEDNQTTKTKAAKPESTTTSEKVESEPTKAIVSEETKTKPISRRVKIRPTVNVNSSRRKSIVEKEQEKATSQTENSVPEPTTKESETVEKEQRMDTEPEETKKSTVTRRPKIRPTVNVNARRRKSIVEKEEEKASSLMETSIPEPTMIELEKVEQRVMVSKETKTKPNVETSISESKTKESKTAENEQSMNIVPEGTKNAATESENIESEPTKAVVSEETKTKPIQRRAKIQPKVNLNACRSRKSVDQKEEKDNQTTNTEPSLSVPTTTESATADQELSTEIVPVPEDTKKPVSRRAKIQPKVNLNACRSRKSVDQKEEKDNQTANTEPSIAEPTTKESATAEKELSTDIVPVPEETKKPVSRRPKIHPVVNVTACRRKSVVEKEQEKKESETEATKQQSNEIIQDKVKEKPEIEIISTEETPKDQPENSTDTTVSAETKKAPLSRRPKIRPAVNINASRRQSLPEKQHKMKTLDITTAKPVQDASGFRLTDLSASVTKPIQKKTDVKFTYIQVQKPVVHDTQHSDSMWDSETDTESVIGDSVAACISRLTSEDCAIDVGKAVAIIPPCVEQQEIVVDQSAVQKNTDMFSYLPQAVATNNSSQASIVNVKTNNTSQASIVKVKTPTIEYPPSDIQQQAAAGLACKTTPTKQPKRRPKIRAVPKVCARKGPQSKKATLVINPKQPEPKETKFVEEPKFVAKKDAKNMKAVSEVNSNNTKQPEPTVVFEEEKIKAVPKVAARKGAQSMKSVSEVNSNNAKRPEPTVASVEEKIKAVPKVAARKGAQSMKAVSEVNSNNTKQPEPTVASVEEKMRAVQNLWARKNPQKQQPEPMEECEEEIDVQNLGEATEAFGEEMDVEVDSIETKQLEPTVAFGKEDDMDLEAYLTFSPIKKKKTTPKTSLTKPPGTEELRLQLAASIESIVAETKKKKETVKPGTKPVGNNVATVTRQAELSTSMSSSASLPSPKQLSAVPPRTTVIDLNKNMDELPTYSQSSSSTQEDCDVDVDGDACVIVDETFDASLSVKGEFDTEEEGLDKEKEREEEEEERQMLKEELRKEQERMDNEKREKERLEAERKNKEKQEELERIEAEKRENERLEAEQREQERIDAETEKEILEAERLEAVRRIRENQEQQIRVAERKLELEVQALANTINKQTASSTLSRRSSLSDARTKRKPSPAPNHSVFSPPPAKIPNPKVQEYVQRKLFGNGGSGVSQISPSASSSFMNHSAGGLIMGDKALLERLAQNGQRVQSIGRNPAQSTSGVSSVISPGVSSRFPLSSQLSPQIVKAAREIASMCLPGGSLKKTLPISHPSASGIGVSPMISPSRSSQRSQQISQASTSRGFSPLISPRVTSQHISQASRGAPSLQPTSMSSPPSTYTIQNNNPMTHSQQYTQQHQSQQQQTQQQQVYDNTGRITSPLQSSTTYQFRNMQTADRNVISPIHSSSPLPTKAHGVMPVNSTQLRASGVQSKVFTYQPIVSQNTLQQNSDRLSYAPSQTERPQQSRSQNRMSPYTTQNSPHGIATRRPAEKIYTSQNSPQATATTRRQQPGAQTYSQSKQAVFSPPQPVGLKHNQWTEIREERPKTFSPISKPPSTNNISFPVQRTVGPGPFQSLTVNPCPPVSKPPTPNNNNVSVPMQKTMGHIQTPAVNASPPVLLNPRQREEEQKAVPYFHMAHDRQYTIRTEIQNGELVCIVDDAST